MCAAERAGGAPWSVVLALHIEITGKAVLLAAALSGLLAAVLESPWPVSERPKCAAWERLLPFLRDAVEKRSPFKKDLPC